MRTVAVIGKNFGDEGKGLVTAGLCSCSEQPLIIRHNGGAQAGHTVETGKDGTRFVHHQIGSGAEYGASTLLAESFHPDLYQLRKELADFRKTFGFLPDVSIEPEANVTIIDDVLINMAIETERGKHRHGSCGMGVNACCERVAAGYGISYRDVADSTADRLAETLRSIRKEYTLPRVHALGIKEDNPYDAMLRDETVLVNFAAEICGTARLVPAVNASGAWLARFGTLLFETGQGLLLDEDYAEYAPHLTASKTGVAEAVRFLEKRGLTLDEAIYVTRPYVTRHGAGPLPFECSRRDLPGVLPDGTNVANPWQGEFRYARHESVKRFMRPLLQDVSAAGIMPSLAVTHLDETGETMFFHEAAMTFADFCRLVKPYFHRIYASRDRCSAAPVDA